MCLSEVCLVACLFVPVWRLKVAKRKQLSNFPLTPYYLLCSNALTWALRRRNSLPFLCAGFLRPFHAISSYPHYTGPELMQHNQSAASTASHIWSDFHCFYMDNFLPSLSAVLYDFSITNCQGISLLYNISEILFGMWTDIVGLAKVSHEKYISFQFLLSSRISTSIVKSFLWSYERYCLQHSVEKEQRFPYVFRRVSVSIFCCYNGITETLWFIKHKGLYSS